MVASEAYPHREEKLNQETPARHPNVVRQGGSRSDAPDIGGVLRTTVLRSLTRFPPTTRLPYRPNDDSPPLEGNSLVHRRRHQGVLRQHRPYAAAVDPPREDPRQ